VADYTYELKLENHILLLNYKANILSQLSYETDELDKS